MMKSKWETIIHSNSSNSVSNCQWLNIRITSIVKIEWLNKDTTRSRWEWTWYTHKIINIIWILTDPIVQNLNHSSSNNSKDKS